MWGEDGERDVCMCGHVWTRMGGYVWVGLKLFEESKKSNMLHEVGSTRFCIFWQKYVVWPQYTDLVIVGFMRMTSMLVMAEPYIGPNWALELKKNEHG